MEEREMAVVKCPSCGNPITVPEKRTGLWWGIGCLIAALGIPFIVAIVGLLAAIAIPSFVKARETSMRNACINNMRMVDAAKEQAALQQHHKDGDTISEQELAPFLKNGLTGLVCPNGGHYTSNAVGKDPECNVHGSLSEALNVRSRVPRHTGTGDMEPAAQPQN